VLTAYSEATSGFSHTKRIGCENAGIKRENEALKQATDAFVEQARVSLRP
jgi:hypothetical protein